MKRFVPALLIGLVGAAVLVSLGLWQLHRLSWKEAVLAEINERIGAAPVPLPDRPDPAADRYLPVQVSGELGSRELHVLVSTHEQGAGFRIVTSLQTGDGRRVLLDRGFVPYAQKDAPRRGGHVSVVGNLHWPEERDGFTPDNDPEGNYWYAREVDVMAAALDTEPVLIVARSETPADPAILPLPIDSSGIPNNHLGYAIQWFGFAVVWLGMTGLLLHRIARRTP